MAIQHTSQPSGDDSERYLRPAAFTNHVVEAGGIKLNYLDYGRAGRPPVLCVHGGGANAHWFDFVAPGFNTDYHVRAIDLRGHGDSEWADPPDYSYARYAADLSEAVDRLDLRDFVLIGHSMGGMCSLIYSATYPGRVAKLIVVDSTFHMTADRIANFHRVGRAGSGYASEEEFATHFRLRPESSLAPKDVLHHVARMSARQTADGRWRTKFDRKVYATRSSLNGFPYWEKIKIPALIIKIHNSPRIPAEAFAEVQLRCPQAELTEVIASDHHITLDNPSGFVHAVSPWLAKQREHAAS